MKASKWLKYFLFLSLTSFIFVLSINYIVDPLWIYKHNNKFNSQQSPINERQVKINKMYFDKDETINTLLLGSSRVTYLNQNDFSSLNVFNLAQDLQCPFELDGTIEAAKKIQGNDFKIIIIGFDFSASSMGSWMEEQKIGRPSQSIYLQNAKDSLYRLKSTLSYSTLKYSIENIRSVYSNDNQVYYDRNNVKYYMPHKKEAREGVDNFVMDIIKKDFYGTYIYDENITNIYKILIEHNPKTRFIAFTTPVTFKLYNLKNEYKLQDEYKRWLKELTLSFGEVYDFNGVNSVTMNDENFRDPHHFDVRIGKLIADKLMNVKNEKIPKDFGFLLNKDNIDTYINTINIHDKREPKLFHLK